MVVNVLCNSSGTAKRPKEGTTKQWSDKRQQSIMCIEIASVTFRGTEIVHAKGILPSQ